MKHQCFSGKSSGLSKFLQNDNTNFNQNNVLRPQFSFYESQLQDFFYNIDSSRIVVLIDGSVWREAQEMLGKRATEFHQISFFTQESLRKLWESGICKLKGTVHLHNGDCYSMDAKHMTQVMSLVCGALAEIWRRKNCVILIASSTPSETHRLVKLLNNLNVSAVVLV